MDFIFMSQFSLPILFVAKGFCLSSWHTTILHDSRGLKIWTPERALTILTRPEAWSWGKFSLKQFSYYVIEYNDSWYTNDCVFMQKGYFFTFLYAISSL